MKKMVNHKLVRYACVVLSLLLLAKISALCVTAQPAAGAVNDEKVDDAEALDGKLVFAHVLYRHGDRTIIQPYPTDPWKDPQEWPVGWGQLTKTGKQQHYRLGQWLRNRYDGLLNSTYSENEIYVQSTDVDRTLMSAESNLAGLYPPIDAQVWNKDIRWQPIPVHTTPEKYDRLLAGKAPCPAYEYALSALKNSPEFQKYNARYKYLYDYLSKYTGSDVDSMELVQRLNNTLFIETLYNKTLPEWTSKVYPSDDMTFISNFVFSTYTYTRHLARLRTGPLVKEILERFAAKADGVLEPDRNVWIYSAHDSTVGSLLNTLKIFDLHSPPYTACVLMELRMDSNHKPFVTIFYKNTTAEPKPMYIPNCGTTCPLDKMFTLYQDILPRDWMSECKLSTMMMTYEEANTSIAMGVLVAIISVALFLSYIVIIHYRRLNYRNYFAYSAMA